MSTISSVAEPSTNPASRFRAGLEVSVLVRWLPFVLFYTLLVNIPFWTAARWLGIFQNGWLSVDYVVVGLVALFAPRILSAALLVAAIAIDVLAGLCQTYFLSPAECLENISVLRQFSMARVLTVAAVVLLVALAAGAAAALPSKTIQTRYRGRAALCLLAFAAVCLSVDGATVLRRYGSVSGFLHRHSQPADAITSNYFTEFRLARIPTSRLIHIEHGFNNINMNVQAHEKPAYSVASAAADAIRHARLAADGKPGQLPNIVVIVVESWGLDQEAAIRDALVQPYSQPELLARYDVIRGTVPHFGNTIGGEARELCGSSMGFHILAAAAQELQNCIPRQLAALGYHDMALHGMEGNLFNRSEWYRTIGFEEIRFRGQFEQEGLPECKGAFTGTCDTAIAEWIGKRLGKKDDHPDFVYWMTLNSHLPVLVPAPLRAPVSCSFDGALSQQSPLCSWYQLIANVHQSIAQLAMAHLDRPTVFAIVGDHAPPFTDPVLRERFSPEVVPYLILAPRRAGSSARQIAASGAGPSIR